MSSDRVALALEGIGKSYPLAVARLGRNLRDDVIERVKHPFRGSSKETFWALKDVTANVNEGEVVGVIGPNGAGKSTLLKVLSRVTEPTCGELRLYGRIGSLLEVGTGFHPELTGRENIYLNGAILGMRKRDIARQFDEIVEFAEVARFLETPVKRYSSGMHVRLAFAVAAHLNPEILIIDEVLAVGDAAFQRRCLGKMEDVATQQGRTVLFVSHSMASIQSLCTRCILMENGQVAYDGETDEAVHRYVSAVSGATLEKTPGDVDLTCRENSRGDGQLHLRRVTLQDQLGRTNDVILMGSAMRILIDVEGLTDIPDVIVAARFVSDVGDVVTNASTQMVQPTREDAPAHREQIVFSIDRLPLLPGQFALQLTVTRVSDGAFLDIIDRAIRFTVLESDVYGTGFQFGRWDGKLFLDLEWERRSLEATHAPPAGGASNVPTS